MFTASAAPLLLTGFEPFSVYPVNPSLLAAQAVAERFAGRVIALQLPVDYFPARDLMLATLAEVRPSACLCLGQARSDEFRLEQLARKPVQFADLPGDAEFIGTWPWEQMEAVFRQDGVPHRRSTDAGRYVCESTYWSLLDVAREGYCSGPTGFLHVPAISPAWPAERTINVVMSVVAAYIESVATVDAASRRQGIIL